MVINMDIILLIIAMFATIIDAPETPNGTRDKTQPHTQDVKNWISKTKHYATYSDNVHIRKQTQGRIIQNLLQL